ncbi:MAG TPA: sigma-70 family RNA polymerase sigma factor [Thermoanaerobaculia bacterium]|jgi:RNA polymerase sigma-70 factor (ECF subfamily)
MEPTDGELLERSRNRDPEAFGQLVDRYKHPMVAYLARLSGCRERAEDFAQEAFVRFYQQLGRYREEGNLMAYLFRIGTNLVVSDERRKRRWRLLEPFLAPANGHGKGPREELLAGEEQCQVSRALAGLDPLYRAPLVLREIEGRSYLEIADVLGVSEGTVKSRLHRGRQLLREKLAPYWNGNGSH